MTKPDNFGIVLFLLLGLSCAQDPPIERRETPPGVVTVIRADGCNLGWWLPDKCEQGILARVNEVRTEEPEARITLIWYKGYVIGAEVLYETR